MKKVLLLALCLVASNGFAMTVKEQGQLLYKYACSTCHAANKAKGLGAPEAFDKKAWANRIANAKKIVESTHRFKTVDDYFLYHIQLGKGLMHHGGLCNESKIKHKEMVCDEASYLAAIAYMTGES